MRVLQIGMSKHLGGVERFVYNYATSLKKNNIVFDYVDLKGSGLAEEQKLRESGSIIYTLNSSLKHPFLAAKQIRKIIREGEYRCVHVNMLSAANPVPAIAALQAGAKVIVHSHNAQTIGIHRKILHGINTFFLRNLPLIRLACGKKAGEWMYGRKNFKIISNAIDIEKFRFHPELRDQLRQELHIGDDTLVLGFVGRLSAQKNPSYLIKILHAVKNRITKDVKLLVVGTGDQLYEITDLARALDLEKDILHVGMQEDTSGWYSAMDAFLLPSLFEGLPFVGIEAQAAGLPCFMSDQISEEIKLTKLVHLCELTEKADNWADEILKNCDASEDRSRFADLISETDYSINRSTAMLVDLYTDCSK